MIVFHGNPRKQNFRSKNNLQIISKRTDNKIEDLNWEFMKKYRDEETIFSLRILIE